MTYARLADGPDQAIRSALAGDASGVIVETSGSTGRPREVLLSASALVKSAEATHRRLSGPGRWLLALPTDRIAGAQVLIRSSLAGTTPVALASGRFSAEGFASATDSLIQTTDRGLPLYTSLVPTQVRRALLSPTGREALGHYTAVLVGGAPLGEMGNNAFPGIVETYGATETSGGCVYDGRPLDGVTVAVDDEGRISLGGKVVADGYADGDDDGLRVGDGIRWYRTPDLGTWEGGRLAVQGRADDVIVTGGHKVHPETVEAALRVCCDVEEAVVVGVPDPEWGARIVALLVTRHPMPLASEATARLASALPPHSFPREIRGVEALPLLPGGKIDRRAATRLAIETLGKES